jgi:putative spermidine/putrescine transport system permease protein
VSNSESAALLMGGAPGGGFSLEQVELKRRRQRRFVQLAPIALLYTVGLVLPYFYLLRMSFNKYDAMLIYRETFSLANYLRILTDGFYLHVAFRTIVLGVEVTLFTLIIGYPIAWKIAQSKGKFKSVLLAAVLSPLLINLVVRTYGWMTLLDDHGVINGWLMNVGVITHPLPLSNNLGAVVMGLGHVTLPFMVLSLVSVMESLPAQVIEAAESLGASKWRIFREVVWPLTWSGVGAGSILVFCFSISAFVTPTLLGGGKVATVSTLIYEQFTYSVNWPLGSALVFLLLAMNLVVIVLHARLFKHGD